MSFPRPPQHVVTVRSTGCGPALGVVLVVIGALVLLVHYNVIPHRIVTWWPALLIALGLLLLIRHYWRAFRSRHAVVMPEVGPIVQTRPRHGPPLMPVIVIALGAYLLLSNLHYISLGVIVAAVLVVFGLSLLVRRRA